LTAFLTAFIETNYSNIVDNIAFTIMHFGPKKYYGMLFVYLESFYQLQWGAMTAGWELGDWGSIPGLGNIFDPLVRMGPDPSLLLTHSK